MNADPIVMRHFERRLDPAASDAWVAQLEERFDRQGFGLWALERLVEGDFIGFTGLNPLRPGTPGGVGMEVGWRLAQPAWGHGYASEAARVALRIGLVEVGLPKIWSITAVSNVASQAVMRRIGMLEHSRFEHPGVEVGHPVRPQVAYRIDGADGERLSSDGLGDESRTPLDGRPA